MAAILHTSYYYASHTGKLIKVLSEIPLATPKITAKYRRMVQLSALWCWGTFAFDFSYYGFCLLFTGGNYDINLSPFVILIPVDQHHIVVVRLFIFLTTANMYAVWLFPQGMNFVIAVTFYNQFRKLDMELKAVVLRTKANTDDRQHFPADRLPDTVHVESIRKRHQELCRAVERADRFFMISNVGGFCCQILNVIFHVKYFATVRHIYSREIDPSPQTISPSLG